MKICYLSEKEMDMKKNVKDALFLMDRKSHLGNEAMASTWRSPSNIALVKYWGKYAVQLPANPSLSFTLKESYTETRIELIPAADGKRSIRFFFEGKEKPAFIPKVEAAFRQWEAFLPFLKNAGIRIDSRNSFPHSAGIASSASAFSAMALGVCDLAARLSGERDRDVFFRKASFLARLGSGSAARSVYPEAALWGYSASIPGSSDEWAIPLESLHPVFQDFQDSILITDAAEKAISSTAGHGLMEGHPYAAIRFQRAARHSLIMSEILARGDLAAFVELVEAEALELHALMMSSHPSFMLMRGSTVEIIHKIRHFREQSGIPLCFTLDAGPNVHLLYPHDVKEKVGDWVREELTDLCPQDKIIYDVLGQGPEKR